MNHFRTSSLPSCVAFVLVASCLRASLAMSLIPSDSRRFALLLVFAFFDPVWVIMVPRDYVDLAYEEGNKSPDREFIFERVARDEKEREDFSRSILCIVNFLDKYIHKPAFTSLITVEKADGVARSLAMALQDRFAFFRHSVDVDFGLQQPATNAILLMPNASSLRDDFYILDPCDRGCPFIGILITPLEDEESFMEEAVSLAQSMWIRRISFITILATVADSVLAAGVTGFEPNQTCVPSSPVILDKCEGGSWKLGKIKPPEMNNCILKLAYFEEPPYVVTVNVSEQLHGFEGSLTEEAMKEQQTEKLRVQWNDNTSYAEQVRMLLYNEDMADLVIGRILQQSHDDIGYSTTYDMLKVVWIVPKIPNVSLKGLVQPFHPYVWAAICGSLVLGAVIKYFLSHDLSWLDIFALIIGVSTARQPVKLSSKIQFLSWSVFGLFLTQVYVDSLADQLIYQSDLKFETMNQLISSSFQIGGTASLASIFDVFNTDEVTMKIKEKFVIFDQNAYLTLFNDLLEGRNSSFALVAVLNSSRSDPIETMYAYTMTTDVICSFPLALAAWKGFPYLRRIDDKIHDYIDFGIFDFMIDLAIAKNTRVLLFQIAQNQEYKSELHLQQFVPAFLLMVIGFSSGLLFFILEIVIYPCKLLEQ